MALSESAVFFIGCNYCGQFGLNDDDDLKEEFTECPNKRINRVFPSNQYIIYADNDYKNIWSAGLNEYGQCGVGNFEKEIKQYFGLTYFSKNRINIKKICVNIASYHTFFISDIGKLYGCGFNENGEMGLTEKEQKIEDKSQRNRKEPIVIDELSNIIDAKPGNKWSVALSSNKWKISFVITNWSRTHNVGKDIINIIILFTRQNTVYLTRNYFQIKNEKKKIKYKNRYKWNEVEIFADKQIIKIATGKSHILFLEDTGVIWCCGKGEGNQLGFGHDENVHIPTQIKYFNDNNIMIVDIQCGAHHNLALDIYGKLYCWGYNICGQCGDDTKDSVITIRLNPYFAHYFVDIIKCGYQHSYVKTKCNKHFMFGSNCYSECISFNGAPSIYSPHRIDEILKTQFNIQSIWKVIPGLYNTTIICKNCKL